VTVGVGVGDGVTEGGGLNFGPGHPARRKQVRTNAPADLGRRASPRAGKMGLSAKTYFALRLGTVRSFANKGSRGSDVANRVRKERLARRLCRIRPRPDDPSRTRSRC